MEIEGPEGTPYADRFYQLKLVLPADYPNSPPRYVHALSGTVCDNEERDILILTFAFGLCHHCLRS